MHISPKARDDGSGSGQVSAKYSIYWNLNQYSGCRIVYLLYVFRYDYTNTMYVHVYIRIYSYII